MAMAAAAWRRNGISRRIGGENQEWRERAEEGVNKTARLRSGKS